MFSFLYFRVHFRFFLAADDLLQILQEKTRYGISHNLIVRIWNKTKNFLVQSSFDITILDSLDKARFILGLLDYLLWRLELKNPQLMDIHSDKKDIRAEQNTWNNRLLDGDC